MEPLMAKFPKWICSLSRKAKFTILLLRVISSYFDAIYLGIGKYSMVCVLSLSVLEKN